MKLEEIKKLNEWFGNGQLDPMSLSDIEILFNEATRSKFVIEKDVLLSFNKLSTEQIIYFIHNSKKEIYGYSIFNKEYDNIYKRNDVFTFPKYRKRHYQLELLGRAMQEQNILVCNGDSLSPDATRFWKKAENFEKTNSFFKRKIFDFEEKQYVTNPEILPEEDTQNRFRYVLSLKGVMDEKYLVGRNLYENLNHPKVKKLGSIMYGRYVNFDFGDINDD